MNVSHIEKRGGVALVELPKKEYSKVIKEFLKFVRVVGSAARAACNFVYKAKIPQQLKSALKATKAPGLILVPSMTMELVRDVKNIAKNRGEKVSAFQKAKDVHQIVTKSAGLVGEAATLCEILEMTGAASKDIVAWIPAFGIVQLCFGTITAGFDAKSLYDLRKIEKEFGKSIKDASKDIERELDPKKMDELISLLDLTKEKIIPLLQKKKILPEQTKAIQKINAVATRLRLGGTTDRIAAAKEATKIVKTLKGRVTILKTFDAISLVGTIASMAAAIFITFVPPLAIAGLAILALTATVSLVCWGAKLYLFNKDPFDDKSKKVAHKALYDFSKAIEDAKKKVQAKEVELRNSAYYHPEETQ